MRSYSPGINFITPKVIYNEAMTEVWFNPRNTHGLVEDLQEEQMKFINMRIGKALVDFSDTVSHTTNFGHWRDNRIRGKIGELPVGTDLPLSMMWETGLATVEQSRALRCSYDNSTCYMAKNVPVIFSTSAAGGYHSGGQNLTISGHGFSNGNISVSVDGVDCKVTQRQDKSVSCDVQPKGNSSVVDAPYSGSNGISWRFDDNNNRYGSLSSFSDSIVYDKEIALTEFETGYSVGHKYRQQLRSVFVAPATKRYRFYMASDDSSRVYFNPNGTDPAGAQLVLTFNGNIGYRDYFRRQLQWVHPSIKTEWFDLEEGKEYYLEVRHHEGSGGDHLTVSVEIEQDAGEMVGHHHAMREVQKVGFYSDAPREKTQIEVSNIDSGTFKLLYMHPTTMEPTPTGKISANATEA